jgi:ribosomal protein S18 acetylase RimI-like enzyme
MIRPLIETDLARIKAIDVLAFASDEQYDDGTYRLMLQSGLSIVALDTSGTVVGYAFVERRPYSHVRSIAVDPAYRRHGYGRAMLHSVIKSAMDSVDLLVDESNRAALQLYESLGFVRAEMCPTEPPKRRLVLALKPGPD